MPFGLSKLPGEDAGSDLEKAGRAIARRYNRGSANEIKPGDEPADPHSYIPPFALDTMREDPEEKI